jgi:hypothetical protein
VSEHDDQHEPLIDRSIDGLLDGPQRDAAEDLLQHDRGARRTVQLQQGIDASLQRQFQVPSGQDLAAILERAEARAAPAARGWLGSGRFRLAAMLVAAVGVALIWSTLIKSRPTDAPYGRWQTFEALYAAAADGEVAYTPCTTRDLPELFWTSFRHRLDPLETPDPGTSLEWVLCNTLSRSTICLRARVKGETALLFVDLAKHDDPTGQTQTLTRSGDLRLTRASVGPLVLYELSPLEEPSLLHLFRRDRERESQL